MTLRPDAGHAALVEALMGFQFNHVGGGTKTRRPITLHMKYNSACVQPNCYLITEDYGEQEVSLEELQVHWLNHAPTPHHLALRILKKFYLACMHLSSTGLCFDALYSGEVSIFYGIY